MCLLRNVRNFLLQPFILEDPICQVPLINAACIQYAVTSYMRNITRTIQGVAVEWSMNNELGRMCKETVAPYFLRLRNTG
jgi:hypothetical protein